MKSHFLALLTVSALFVASSSAQAMPATVNYKCAPALPRGDKISIDFNSGGQSITVEFPNGQSVRMPRLISGSGFRYGTGNIIIYGKGEKTVTLDIAGQPSRDCNTLP